MLREIKDMQCKQCKQLIPYNYHYHMYECNCGKTYNGLGQELAPKEQWQDEYDNE